MNILSRSFYNRDTETVARALLGKKLVRVLNGQILSGMIVETEAYINTDEACHAYRGLTESNKALFGPVGHAYVYFTYGMHYCLNAVSHTSAHAGGVLIRALEPLEGIETMQCLRKMTTVKNSTNGPGKLTQALAITKQFNHYDLTSGQELYIENYRDISDTLIGISARIGISKAVEKPWRFFIKNNNFISKK